MFKLVLIDDDAEVLAINQKYLTGAGFTVYTAISPREGVLSIRKNLPDCILLDVMLPEADGYRVCRYIRSFSSVPILFLTARSSEEDVIRGLTCGGDDYLVKPYSLRELKARVDLLIRRRRQLAQASSDLVLTIGNLSIDRVAHTAFYREQDLCLANREYEVLLYLAEHPDRDSSSTVSCSREGERKTGREFCAMVRYLLSQNDTLWTRRSRCGSPIRNCPRNVCGDG